MQNLFELTSKKTTLGIGAKTDSLHLGDKFIQALIDTNTN